MTSKWEALAREDAEFFILTDVDSIRDEGETREDAFFRTGRETVDEILRRCEPLLKTRGKALEIGSGIGRLSLAMAEHFESVCAVDVSETMLRQLRSNAEARGIANVSTRLPHEAWDEPDSVDLAYSSLVFQHIADAGIIESYVQCIARALGRAGCAHLQFDTRPRSISYRLRNALPDWALPRAQRRGIRRIRRSVEWLRHCFETAGLRVAREHGAGGAEHAFLLTKN